MPGVIIFDPEDKAIGFSVGDDQAAGVYLDIETDTLYLTDLTNIIEWEGDAVNNMTYTWRSGRLRSAKKINLGGLMVEADSYTSLIVKLYAMLDNTLTLITTLTITDDEPVRIPGGYLSNLYEIEVISTDRVTSITLGQSIFDLASG
jgi:hypothetical protein